ncbi:MAG: O-methyltransferase family 3 [Conexibacter sp.]|nr:O-methyltransferase family 3 [Conexibacter sp.]
MSTWDAVDTYINAQLVGEDPILDAALARAAAAGLPAHDVAPNQGKLLHLLARISGARTILELGTLAGYSTIWLARALPEGGRLVTLEAEPAYAEVARANLEDAGLADRVEVRVGAALETLPRLEGPFDLVFLDADKQRNPEYLEWALRLTRPGSLIVADNVVRDGELANAASEDPRVQGIRRFTELLGAASNVTATAVQTVGSKGWDGFALALVEAR